jgi:hypothetical protein
VAKDATIAARFTRRMGERTGVVVVVVVVIVGS